MKDLLFAIFIISIPDTWLIILKCFIKMNMILFVLPALITYILRARILQNSLFDTESPI